MNFTSSDSVPPLRTLFWNDFIFHRAAHTVFFSLVVAIGFVWIRQPVPNADPALALDFTFEKSVEKWAPPIACGVAALAALVAAWRYQVVMRIFRKGMVVRGVVQDLIVYAWRSESSSTTTNRFRNNRHAYWAVIAYDVHGVEKTKKIKLPNSGATFGLVKGQPTELSVLPWAPNQPLLRAVYLATKFPTPKIFFW